MSGSKCGIMNFNVYNGIIEDLNALEEAIEEVCDVDTVAKIEKRKREIIRRYKDEK